MSVRLTELAPASGCGCKLPSQQLERILSQLPPPTGDGLVLGWENRDDAAVYRLSPDRLLLSTADFMSPPVDDPYDFGRIAATNAISDIYAMGGTPMLALGLLVWPIAQLTPEMGAEVINGAREVCDNEGVALAGGHSVEGPQPLFGLSVNGWVEPPYLRTNATAREGDWLYLTKPLGIGVLTAALRRQSLREPDLYTLLQLTTQSNRAGMDFAREAYVHSMTDVTGFGLLGHLLEMCRASGTGAELYLDTLPQAEGIDPYLLSMMVPDQTYRNWNAVESQVRGMQGMEFMLLCDPQTSGGLLLSVHAQATDTFENKARALGQPVWRIGRMKSRPGVNILPRFTV
jgi:selenide,water dikinase